MSVADNNSKCERSALLEFVGSFGMASGLIGTLLFWSLFAVALYFII